MRKVISLVCLLSLCPPTEADVLRGKVEFVEPKLQAQTPKADIDPWKAWKDKFAAKVREKTLLRLKELHMTSQGSLELDIRARSGGDIELQVIQDASSNIGLVTENVVRSLDHSSIVRFPAEAKTELVQLDLIVTTLDDDLPQFEAK